MTSIVWVWAGLSGGCVVGTKPRQNTPPDGGDEVDAGGLIVQDAAASVAADAGTFLNPACGPATPAPGGTTVLAVDFQTSPLGPYVERSVVLPDWPGLEWNNTAGVSIRSEGANRFLRVRYPINTHGPENGAQFRVRLDAKYEALWISYRLRFRAGFDPVKGGKLPGLAGVAANTGGRKPNGMDGFSARMMWRRQLAPVQYMYHPDQPSTFGEDFPYTDCGTTRFNTGVWHRVEAHLVMNTPGTSAADPGQKDGVVQGFLDGQRYLNRTDVRFRDVASLGIDVFYFSTFFGGGDPGWNATRDETIDFDDFVISTERSPAP